MLAKDNFEARLAADPNDYEALTRLGEIDLRMGLTSDAQRLLFRASLLRPPSWQAYQYVSLLLRRAEENARTSFDRPAGAPPPGLWCLRGLLSGIRRVPRGSRESLK
ncbi:MAG TPA: tetratricopeptide repeat protein [Chloroflexota bacterium]|nr:tetratricopeptide repeat protein [Chloroflexota bacterium]